MTPPMKRRALLLAGLSAAPGLLLAGDLLKGRRLRTQLCLPPYDYPTHRFTTPVSAGSLPAISYLIDGSGAAVPGDGDGATERLKTIQMDQSKLENDHCRIAQVTVTVSSRGAWFVHLLATQHPGIVLDAQQRPPFERFQRNLFRVDIRPVGLITLQRTETVSVVGKPEFPIIPPQLFWILKEETKRIQLSGQNQNIARFFDVIEQVEIHFSYR